MSDVDEPLDAHALFRRLQYVEQELKAATATAETFRAERDEARYALAEAAQKINVAGPVAHRIDILKEQFQDILLAQRAAFAYLCEDYNLMTGQRLTPESVMADYAKRKAAGLE